MIEVRLRKSHDTIHSLTVANITSGPVRFRSSSLRNSPDNAYTLAKSADTAISIELGPQRFNVKQSVEIWT